MTHKTIRSFTLYFTSREQLEKAKRVAESDNWMAGYIVIRDNISEGEYAIVEFWWDDITPETLKDFLNDINA